MGDAPAYATGRGVARFGYAERHVAQHRLSFDDSAHRFLMGLKNTTEQTAPRVAKKVGKIMNLTH